MRKKKKEKIHMKISKMMQKLKQTVKVLLSILIELSQFQPIYKDMANCYGYSHLIILIDLSPSD